MLIDIRMKKKMFTELGHSDRLNIYVNPSKIYINPACKSIQMTDSQKPLHPWSSNYTCSMTRLQGFRMIIFRLVRNQIWPLLLKIAKPLKSTFTPEQLDIFE